MGAVTQGSEGYMVNVKGKERVAAVLPLQEHWLPLSNLDLLLPPLDVGIFFCYKYSNNFDAMIGALKSSLSKALVTYYPFAGEVVTNLSGEPELLCNNRGVDFTVAYADVGLEELNLHDPDENVENLMPGKDQGVFCVQATELKCGGMMLACKFDHRIADAYSADMFLVGWSEISMMANPISVVPCFRKSLLSPRRPGCVDTSLDRLYVPISSLKMKNAENNETTINRIYYIAAADIKRMQEEASGGGRGRRSKIEAFSAYLWKVIGKGAKRRQVANYKVCRMGMVVNGRSRLNQEPEVMVRYFGNVLTIPYGEIGLNEVTEMQLSEVAEAVHDFVKEAATEEHFRGLIDWVEAHRPEPAATRIYFNEEGDGVNFVVSSGTRFPIAQVKFGWGRPVFGSYHFPWGGSAGYVMPMPSARGNGDWVVYVHLMKDLVEAVDAEAGDIFHPLTSDYVMAG